MILAARLITRPDWLGPAVQCGTGEWCCLPVNRRAWRHSSVQQLQALGAWIAQRPGLAVAGRGEKAIDAVASRPE